MFRCFAQDHEELAGIWAGTTGTAEAWTLGSPIGTGESGSYHVTSAAGRRGACKPAFASDTTARAAHEKIAADLAHSLKLSVPACCLWTDQATGKQYSISMWAFSQADTWGQVLPTLSRTFLTNAAPAFAAARVFHTWIADHDHAGHGGNVVVDLTSSEDKPGVAFIDHAFSLSRVPGFDSHPVAPLAIHYIPPDLEDRGAIQQMCQYINDLEDTMIEGIVRRVPAEFLPLDKADVIIKGLLRRRQELPQAFGVGT